MYYCEYMNVKLDKRTCPENITVYEVKQQVCIKCFYFYINSQKPLKIAYIFLCVCRKRERFFNVLLN